MAPRRLLAVMLGLLVLSSLAASLVPVSNRDQLDTTSPTTGAIRPDPKLPSDGRLLHESFRLGSGKRPVIEAQVGDQLALTVTAGRPATLELEGLGATADVDPDTPARFDVLLLDKGSFQISEIASGRSVGTIRVGSQTAKPEAGKKAGGGSDPGRKQERRRDEGQSQQV